MSDESMPMESEMAAETVNESDEIEQQTSEEKPIPKPKKPAIRKYKVGNEEIALSDDDIAREYSKWRGADAKFREAAAAKKATEDFMKALEEDPEKILNDKRLPLDKKRLAEKWLMEEIDSRVNPVDPRDAKLSEAERKLKEYQDRDELEKKTKEEQEYETVKEQRKSDISKTLGKAMESTHLSKDPDVAASVLREMALYMRAAKERGEDVSPDELVEHIHNSRFSQFYSLAHQFEGEELIEFLGEEIVKRIRKADLSRLKASRGNVGNNTHKDTSWSAGRRGEEDKKPQRMDAQSMKEHVNKLLGVY